MPRRKSPKFNYPLLIIAAIILASSLFVYNIKSKNPVHIDSSTNGSEYIEVTQNTIPADVKSTIPTKAVLGESSRLPESVTVPILMYHYIEYIRDPNDKIRASLTTTPYVLENEIKNLKDNGYTFMTVGELSDVMDGKKQLPTKPIVLTFDDSYRDFYTDAYPILKKYSVKVTQYVITGFLNNPNHMTTAQLKELSLDNLIEMGDHTIHHVWLKGMASQSAQFEIAQSKSDLEKLIGKKVVSFAYPFGAFDLQAIDVVKKAGFTSAVSTIPGTDHRQAYRYFLKRLRPGGRTGPYFISWLQSESK